ncbi:MAG: hypothetical protein ABIC40_06935 [bacterium]
MVLKNCELCGKIYNGNHQTICPDCLEIERQDFEKVRQFIKDNPKISIEVASEATGVDQDRIREFMRQGKIDLADLKGPVLECRRCGKPIYRGEYCIICQNEISVKLRPTAAPKKQPKSASFTRRYRGGG